MLHLVIAGALMTFLTRLNVRPQLVVFDLDETLWPFGVDDYIMRPPYRRVNGTVRDARGIHMEPFPEVDGILKQLHEGGIAMAAASRTSYPEGAFSLIKLLGWNDYFKYKEIYPGSKVAHFKKLAAASGSPYDQMIFFDNESRNITDVTKLGVTCVLTDTFVGLTWKDLEKGFRSFAERHTH